MTTDVHEILAPEHKPTPAGLVVFWCCVALALCAAIARPFLPPRAMTDATGGMQ